MLTRDFIVELGRIDIVLAPIDGMWTMSHEELFEVLAWRQLKIHSSPIGVLDVRNFFAPFLETIETSVSEGFMTSKSQRLFVLEDDPAVLLDRLLEMVEAV